MPITGNRECRLTEDVTWFSASLVPIFERNYVKLIVYGKPGGSYHVPVRNRLEKDDAWRTNATIVLENLSKDWVDPEPFGGSSRYYKVQAAQ